MSTTQNPQEQQIKSWLVAKVTTKGCYGRPVPKDEYGEPLPDREALRRFMSLRFLTSESFARLLGDRWKPRAVTSWLTGQRRLPTDALVLMSEHLAAERLAVLRRRFPGLPQYRGNKLLDILHELQSERL